MTDLLIRNAHVIDPATSLDAPRDLLIEEGRRVPHPCGLIAWVGIDERSETAFLPSRHEAT